MQTIEVSLPNPLPTGLSWLTETLSFTLSALDLKNPNEVVGTLTYSPFTENGQQYETCSIRVSGVVWGDTIYFGMGTYSRWMESKQNVATAWGPDGLWQHRQLFYDGDTTSQPTICSIDRHSPLHVIGLLFMQFLDDRGVHPWRS